VPNSGEIHESTSSWGEAARIDVEGFQVLSEADTKELATRSACAVSCSVDQSYADSPVARFDTDHDVFNKRVNESVPEDVHEANELVAVTGDDPPRLCRSH
jgi:hypothetical protein